MTVSVTKNLSPHIQALADCREAEKLAAAEVERLKGELKTAKAVWEERVADTNRAADDVIDKEKEPTLFDDLSDPPQPATETTPGGDGGGGGSGAGEKIDDAEIIASLVVTGQQDAGEEPAGVSMPLSLPAAASAAEPPTWHRLTLDNAFETEIDIPTAVIDTLKAAGVETCGVLAAKLVEGESFGLAEKHVEYLCRAIEQMSEDDETPVVLTSEGDEGEGDGDADGESDPAGNYGGTGRNPSSAAKWEAMFARNPGAYSTPSDERRRSLIEDFRFRQAAADGGHADPRWGMWSEFEVKLASGDAVFVCYEPGEAKGDDAIGYFADHFEFTGTAISSTGYRSHFQNFDKKHPRPASVSLAEWAREFAESLYVERQVEAKKEKRGGGKKAAKEKPAKGSGKGKKAVAGKAVAA